MYFEVKRRTNKSGRLYWVCLHGKKVVARGSRQHCLDRKNAMAEQILTEWWKESFFDSVDCKTLDEYMDRVIQRFKTLYGLDLPHNAVAVVRAISLEDQTK